MEKNENEGLQKKKKKKKKKKNEGEKKKEKKKEVYAENNSMLALAKIFAIFQAISYFRYSVHNPESVD